MSALDRVEQSLNFTRVAGVVRGALFDRLDGVDDRAVIAIAKVQAQLEEINDIETRKEALLPRMAIIRQLQSERVTLVRGMMELATTIPEGIFFSSLKRSPEGVSLTGVAQSSSRISALMEQLTNTPSFDQPELNVINVGDTQEFELWVSSVRSETDQLTPEGQR